MKKIVKIIILMLIAALAEGCSVKQNQLVILEKHQNPSSNVEENLSLNFNMMPQKISIEQNAALIKKLDLETIPLAVSTENGIVIGYTLTDNDAADEANSKVITGNMVQLVNLYAVDTKNNEKSALGEFLSLRDFQFDETGKLFAFIDGMSNIYIYDLEAKQLQKIIEGRSYNTYDSLSWSRDSKRLLINHRMTLDISSKQLISFAVEAYNPFVEQKYNNQEIYIVQMKNNEYNDMIALYNFDSKSFKSLANGVFLDSDNISLIYTKQAQSNLFVLNLETLESKSVETGPIYNAKIMKSTGEIIYSTINPDLTSSSRYLLVKLNPGTGDKKTAALSTPTFYLSPDESKLYFIGDYYTNRIVADTTTLNITQPFIKIDSSDLSDIKAVLLKMFELDYNFTGSYEEYEKQANTIYINTYDPIPQEALENKLIDFKRFNMPLPTWQKEPAIPPTLTLNTVSIKGDKASVNIGLFYINAIELARVDGNWRITGFSTHPDSKEIKDVRNIIQNHLSDIKNKNRSEALKYWKNDGSDFDKAQRQIVEDLIKNSNSIKMDIGEIELWSLSEPHRAESSQTALEAKAKIIINNKGNLQKYKLVLSKSSKGNLSIASWSIDPLGISQLR